jgi:hypothetical protein
MAALAHAHDHNAALGCKRDSHGLGKGLTYAGFEPKHGSGFYIKRLMGQRYSALSEMGWKWRYGYLHPGIL